MTLRRSGAPVVHVLGDRVIGAPESPGAAMATRAPAENLPAGPAVTLGGYFQPAQEALLRPVLWRRGIREHGLEVLSDKVKGESLAVQLLEPPAQRPGSLVRHVVLIDHRVEEGEGVAVLQDLVLAGRRVPWRTPFRVVSSLP